MSSTSDVRDLLRRWIAARVDTNALSWLDTQLQNVATGDKQALFLGFGLAPRKVGKAPLNLSESEIAAARDAVTGWNPIGWTVDQTARTALLLAWPASDPAALQAGLDPLFTSAEINELIALYQALPLLPFPESLKARCADGIRTNIRGVFSAIAHHNPYPAKWLDEAAWNQLVLKALFVDLALDPIQGLDDRRNATLTEILLDYAEERTAAGRTISPELWRVAAPHIGPRGLKHLERILQSPVERDQQAAALALAQIPTEPATRLLATRPDLVNAIETGRLHWRDLAVAATP